MDYLSLKIDNQWAVLDEGTEIALEGNNPLFSDAGSKSYLFRLHVESNRHIFGTSDEIYGENYYKVIDGKRSTLYVMGIPVMTGKIALEDEVMMEDGYVAVNLVSGNLEFAQMIEGMNCREVEQAEDVVVGARYTKIVLKEKMHDYYSVTAGDAKREYERTFELPDEFNIIEDNVVSPYPAKKYCTIRAACASSSTKNLNRFLSSGAKSGLNGQVSVVSEELFVLESGRRNSGICFYVNYFLDCLFKTLGIAKSYNALEEIEDANRLAFVNLRCKTERYASPEIKSFDYFQKEVGGISRPSAANIVYASTGDAYREVVSATSDNFPDVDISEVIDGLKNGFGARFIQDLQNNTIRIVLLRDVLRDDELLSIPCDIFSSNKVCSRTEGFILSYGGDENDASFVLPSASSIKTKESYSDILRIIAPYDRGMYVDARNGNSYVIKVSSEADTEVDRENLNPSLFEVGEYCRASYGNCSDESTVEKISIPFSAITNFDVSGKDNVEKAKKGEEDSTLNPVYAILLKGEITPRDKVYVEYLSDLSTFTDSAGSSFQAYASTGFYYMDYIGSNSDVSSDPNWHPVEEEPIANSLDVGFMLGVMRGPGNGSKVSYFSKNFDGENNERVAFTSANYAFTSDSIDHCNRDFDYNGKADGGVDYDGRFSLKLRAGKYDKDGNPIKDADGNPIIIQDSNRANRGLYDKFWKEYAYFTVNKKILRITCRMEIADLAGIDWTKRYRIGEHVGFIASYSYSVSTSGMSDVEIDLYYL